MDDRELVYLGGEVLPADAARIAPADRGFLYGDGLFETMRVVNGVPFLLDRHLRRLCDSCRDLHFGDCIEPGALADGAGRLIRANGVGDGRLRITVSRGGGVTGLEARPAAPPTVFMQAHAMDLPPLDGSPPVTLAVSPYRINERSPVVRHKSLSYLANLMALTEARRRGADQVIFLNSQGRLAEGAISNLFLVHAGVVLTPEVSCGLLPGITREVVLELCGQVNIPAREGAWGLEALDAADEVFCTNSLRGIVPVSRILDRPGPELSDHTVTGRLQRLYAELVRCDCAPG